jgi:hypothetical protein
MQLYDKLKPRGATVALRIAANCGMPNAKVTTALTPPGSRHACITFPKVLEGGDWTAVRALEARGFVLDVLFDGYATQVSQAFVGDIFTNATAEELAP